MSVIFALKSLKRYLFLLNCLFTECVSYEDMIWFSITYCFVSCQQYQGKWRFVNRMPFSLSLPSNICNSFYIFTTKRPFFDFRISPLFVVNCSKSCSVWSALRWVVNIPALRHAPSPHNSHWVHGVFFVLWHGDIHPVVRLCSLSITAVITTWWLSRFVIVCLSGPGCGRNCRFAAEHIALIEACAPRKALLSQLFWFISIFLNYVHRLITKFHVWFI